MKAAFFALLATSTYATVGVDLSTLASSSTYSCLKNNGMNFAIPRAWCSYGAADANGPSQVINARAAGVPYVDIYMFPCRSHSGPDQVNQLVSYMASHGVTVEHESTLPNAKGVSAGHYVTDDQEFEVSDEIPTVLSEFEAWRKENVVETNETNGNNYGMIWIDVETNPSSGCSWSGYSGSSNCDYLVSIIN